MKLTYYDETKNMAHDSQIVRSKETPKLSHGKPSQRQASDTYPPMNVLDQDRHEDLKYGHVFGL